MTEKSKAIKFAHSNAAARSCRFLKSRPPRIVTAGVSVRMGVGGRRHRRQRRTMMPRLSPQRSDVARVMWENRKAIRKLLRTKV